LLNRLKSSLSFSLETLWS